MRKERKRVGWNKARKIRWVLVVVCWEILVCEVKVVHALPTATHRHTNTHTMPFNPDQQKCNYLPEERKVCEREIMRLVWKTTSVWILIIIFSSNTPSNATSPNRHLYISDSLHNSNKVALSDIKILDRPITKSDYEFKWGSYIHNGPPQSKTWRCLSFIYKWEITKTEKVKVRAQTQLICVVKPL